MSTFGAKKSVKMLYDLTKTPEGLARVLKDMPELYELFVSNTEIVKRDLQLEGCHDLSKVDEIKTRLLSKSEDIHVRMHRQKLERMRRDFENLPKEVIPIPGDQHLTVYSIESASLIICEKSTSYLLEYTNHTGHLYFSKGVQYFLIGYLSIFQGRPILRIKNEIVINPTHSSIKTTLEAVRRKNYIFEMYKKLLQFIENILNLLDSTDRMQGRKATAFRSSNKEYRRDITNFKRRITKVKDDRAYTYYKEADSLKYIGNDAFDGTYDAVPEEIVHDVSEFKNTIRRMLDYYGRVLTGKVWERVDLLTYAIDEIDILSILTAEQIPEQAIGRVMTNDTIVYSMVTVYKQFPAFTLEEDTLLHLQLEFIKERFFRM